MNLITRMSKQMNLCLYIERKVLDVRHMILQKISINHMIYEWHNDSHVTHIKNCVLRYD